MPIGGRGVALQSIDLPLSSFTGPKPATNLVLHGGAQPLFSPYAWEMDANQWNEISRRFLVPENYASGKLNFVLSLDVDDTTTEPVSIALWMKAVADGEATNTDPVPIHEYFFDGFTQNIRYTAYLQGLTPAPNDLIQILFRTNPMTPSKETVIYMTAVRMVYLGF